MTVSIVTQTSVRPEKSEDFARWQGETSNMVSSFPGFVEQRLMPPNPPLQVDWVILQKFASGEQAPFARPQPSDTQFPDPYAAEIFHFVTAFVEHQANLPLDALQQDQPQQLRTRDFDTLDLGAPAGNRESVQEFFAMRRIERPVQADFVFLFDLETWMRQSEREVAVVGHQQETLAIAIEPAHMENAWPVFR